MLEAKNIYKTFPKNNSWALEDINFDIQNNSLGIILGPNGSGKTTFLKILSGLLPADKGCISYKDKQNDLLLLKRITSWCPAENTIFFKNATSYENLVFWKKARGINQSKFDKNLELYCKLFKFSNDHLNSAVQKLSSGTQKKLALILSLLDDPKILLLDEPFVFLDRSQCSFLEQRLTQLVKEFDMSIIVSSHIEPNLHFNTQLSLS